ncbi:hypothetical protein EMGBS3_13190 [Anaerolineaceae bacterium]|nr:hypothetical protein EMGBS3_13190 [Anaerolineaceae bacterium]GBL37460.1 hypothetical protein EMGBD1_11470 [Anaerolineaceae bacterium]
MWVIFPRLALSEVRVHCAGGVDYPQQPRVFEWLGTRYSVAQVLQEWRLPDSVGYRVSTADGAQYELVYRPAREVWEVHALVD